MVPRACAIRAFLFVISRSSSPLSVSPFLLCPQSTATRTDDCLELCRDSYLSAEPHHSGQPYYRSRDRSRPRCREACPCHHFWPNISREQHRKSTSLDSESREPHS